MRLFTLKAENAETDLPEVTAREIYQCLETPWSREIEARLWCDHDARH